MADHKEGETGAGLIFIGLSLWVVDLLIVFFLPAGLKLGHQRAFAAIIAIIAVIGLILITFGYSRRGSSLEE